MNIMTNINHKLFGLKPTERTVNLLMQELGGKKAEEITYKYIGDNFASKTIKPIFEMSFDTDDQRVITGGYLKNLKVNFITDVLQEFIHKLIPENVREIKPKKHFFSQGFYSIPFEEIRKFADMIKTSSKEELEKLFKKV